MIPVANALSPEPVCPGGQREPTRPRGRTVRSGFAYLDAVVGGFKLGGVHVIAARPGTGLSAVLRTITAVAVEDNVATLFFTLGRDVLKEAQNVLKAMLSDIAAYESVSGASFYRAIPRAAKAPNRDDERRGIQFRNRLAFSSTEDLYEVFNDVVGYRNQHPEKRLLVVLDMPKFVGRSIPSIWAHAGKQLLYLAKTTEAAVLVSTRIVPAFDYAGIRRQNHPLIVDIEDYGSVVAHSDVVVAIHQPDYHDPFSPDMGTLGLHVVKNHNAPVGMTRVIYDPKDSRVFEILHGLSSG